MENCKQPASTGSTFVAVTHRVTGWLTSRSSVRVCSSPFLILYHDDAWL